MGEEEPKSCLSEPLQKLSEKLLLVTGDRGDNVILSPISIHMGLNLVLLGADDNSKTKQELIDVLGYKELNASQIQGLQEQYALLLNKFVEITKHSLKARKEFESKQERYNRKVPHDPVVDTFNLLVTKDKGIVKPEFAEKVQKYFNGSFKSISDKEPESKKSLITQMENWSKDAGFEKPFLKPSDLDGKFDAVLINAIRVEAFWFEEFNELHSNETFHNYGSKDATVKGTVLTRRDSKDRTMYFEFTSAQDAKFKRLHARLESSESFQDLSKLNFNALQIPLKGNLSVTIFEPIVNQSQEKGANKRTLINEFARELFKESEGTKGQRLTNMDKVFDFFDKFAGKESVDLVEIPKFKFEKEVDLKSVLKKIGLQRPFNNLAEISNMTQNKVKISGAKHSAMIEFRKQGIKAAGATVIKIVPLSAMIKEEYIHAKIKNPFIFSVRYNNIPLFIGQLTNL